MLKRISGVITRKKEKRPETVITPIQDDSVSSQAKEVRFEDTSPSIDGATTLSRRRSHTFNSSAFGHSEPKLDLQTLPPISPKASRKKIAFSADDFSSEASTDEEDTNLIPELISKFSSYRQSLLHLIDRLNTNIESSDANAKTKSRVKKNLVRHSAEVNRIFTDLDNILSSFKEIPLDDVHVKKIFQRIINRITIIVHFITYKDFENSINWIKEKYNDLMLLKKILTTEYIVPDPAIIGKQIFDIKRLLLSTINKNHELSVYNELIDSLLDKLHTGFGLLGELKDFTPKALKFIYDKIVALGQFTKKVDSSNIQRLFDAIESLLAHISSFLPSVNFHDLNIMPPSKRNDSEDSEDKAEDLADSSKHSRTLFKNLGKGTSHLTELAARPEKIISPRVPGDESNTQISTSSNSARESGSTSETPRTPKDDVLKFHFFSTSLNIPDRSDDKTPVAGNRKRSNSY